MLLQVVLGAEKRKERQAPRGRVSAVQENRARLAEVQQGERQVRAIIGHRSQASLKGEDPSRAAAKCLRELHSVAIAAEGENPYHRKKGKKKGGYARADALEAKREARLRDAGIATSA